MRSYPGDLTAVVLAAAGALVLMVVLSRLFRWYRLRALRLCLLTGTRPQRAARCHKSICSRMSTRA